MPASSDPQATPRVLDVLRQSTQEEGIKLRVVREMRDGEMQTTGVELVSPEK